MSPRASQVRGRGTHSRGRGTVLQLWRQEWRGLDEAGKAGGGEGGVWW